MAKIQMPKIKKAQPIKLKGMVIAPSINAPKGSNAKIAVQSFKKAGK